MLLVTGPTGSGKTTTLYAALDKINSPGKKIITIEDPVEYQLHGINQIHVKPKIGLTFAAGLRHIVRQDPDVIMVGEIRDLETADIGIHAALTGHLVFSTLHTNDAPGAVTRLLDMGVEPYLIASVLEGVLAQRLVRLHLRRLPQALRARRERAPGARASTVSPRPRGCRVGPGATTAAVPVTGAAPASTSSWGCPRISAAWLFARPRGTRFASGRWRRA